MNNSNQTNPYTAPNSNVNNNMQPRSAIPKVIGIISLVLAGLGILGAVANLVMSIFMPAMLEAQMNLGFSKSYLIGSNIVSLITSLWAIFIGIKLVKYEDIGRRHFNYYAAVMVIMSIIAYFVTRNMMANMFKDLSPEASAAAMDVSTISSASVFIAPIIIIIVALLLNQKRVKDSLH